MIIELSIASALIGSGLLMFKPSEKINEDLKIRPTAKINGFNFPLDLLAAPKAVSNKKAQAEASNILASINEFLSAQQVTAEAVSISTSPATWTAEIKYPSSTKLSKITSLIPDISLRIGYPNIRALGARQGITTLGLEITRDSQSLVTLRELLESKAYDKAKGGLIIPLGIESATGEPLIIDLSAAPHLLLTGTTGSGKSVALNAIIASLMYRYTPKDLQFIMIDPKVVELEQYAGLDHIDSDIITDMSEAEKTLSGLVDEMERRYQYLSRHKAKKIDQLSNAKKLNRIVCIVEEYADAYSSKHGQKISDHIEKLAQKSRACGIHLIIVTQRPTVSCLRSEIKTNLPARVTGQLLNKVSSQVAIDQPGAEGLLGNGDMFYLKNGKLIRFQSPFIDEDKELTGIIDFLKHGKKTMNIKTGYLSMSFDDDSGELSGVILKGKQRGKKLAELSMLELWHFQAEIFPCQDSRRLLDSFMGDNDIEQPPSDEKNRLLFSLNSGFTVTELKKSWRKMMQKYHPDKFGDDDLASELNTAYQALKNG